MVSTFDFHIKKFRHAEALNWLIILKYFVSIISNILSTNLEKNLRVNIWNLLIDDDGLNSYVQTEILSPSSYQQLFNVSWVGGNRKCERLFKMIWITSHDYKKFLWPRYKTLFYPEWNYHVIQANTNISVMPFEFCSHSSNRCRDHLLSRWWTTRIRTHVHMYMLIWHVEF